MSTKKKPSPKQLEKNRWKPGKSGNPGGAKPLPPELRNMKRISLRELKREILKYLHCDFSELGKVWSDPEELTCFQRIIVSQIMTAMKGSLPHAEWLLTYSGINSDRPEQGINVKRLNLRELNTLIKLGEKCRGPLEIETTVEAVDASDS